jgi:ornithine carbamoyltransferase
MAMKSHLARHNQRRNLPLAYTSTSTRTRASHEKNTQG